MIKDNFTIEPKSLALDIQEYGKSVRKYTDVNYERFMEKTKEMIKEHLDKHSRQKTDEVKNLTIHIYTY